MNSAYFYKSMLSGAIFKSILWCKCDRVEIVHRVRTYELPALRPHLTVLWHLADLPSILQE